MHQNVCTDCGASFPDDGGPHSCRNAGRVCGRCGASLEAPGARLNHDCGLRGEPVSASDVPCSCCGHPRRDHGPAGESTRCWGPRGNARTCLCPAFAPPLAEPIAHRQHTPDTDPATGERIHVRLRVVAVALRLPSWLVVSMPPPARHHMIVHALRAHGVAPEGEQGFLLSDGTFADRHHAADVARAAGQLLERAPTAGGWHAGLFSEDCW